MTEENRVKKEPIDIEKLYALLKKGKELRQIVRDHYRPSTEVSSEKLDTRPD